MDTTAAAPTAATDPITNSLPATIPNPLYTTPVSTAPTAPVFVIQHTLDYKRVVNMVLILMAAWAGIELLMMLISFMLEKK